MSMGYTELRFNHAFCNQGSNTRVLQRGGVSMSDVYFPFVLETGGTRRLGSGAGHDFK